MNIIRLVTLRCTCPQPVYALRPKYNTGLEPRNESQTEVILRGWASLTLRDLGRILVPGSPMFSGFFLEVDYRKRLVKLD